MSVNQFRDLQRMKGQRTRSKYGNTQVIVDGIRFDSQKEWMRYEELRRLKMAGEIDRLEIHKKYELVPKTVLNGHTYRSISYYADFVYYDCTKDKLHSNDPNSRWVVEDVKSTITRENAVYRIKKKLMAYTHGIEIKEI